MSDTSDDFAPIDDDFIMPEFAPEPAPASIHNLLEQVNKYTFTEFYSNEVTPDYWTGARPDEFTLETRLASLNLIYRLLYPDYINSVLVESCMIFDNLIHYHKPVFTLTNMKFFALYAITHVVKDFVSKKAYDTFMDVALVDYKFSNQQLRILGELTPVHLLNVQKRNFIRMAVAAKTSILILNPSDVWVIETSIWLTNSLYVYSSRMNKLTLFMVFVAIINYFNQKTKNVNNFNPMLTHFHVHTGLNASEQTIQEVMNDVSVMIHDKVFRNFHSTDRVKFKDINFIQSLIINNLPACSRCKFPFHSKCYFCV